MIAASWDAELADTFYEDIPAPESAKGWAER